MPEPSPHDDPNPSRDPVTERELLAGLLGFNEVANFVQVAGDMLARDEPTDSDQQIADSLAVVGVDIDARTIPTYLKPGELSEAELGIIRDSAIPLIALYGIANALHPKQHDMAWKTAAENEKRQYSDPLALVLDIARLRAMPLVHTTSVNGLRQLMADGGLISNREVYERTLQTGGSDPDSLMIGATNSTDRKFGLDRFVFADFGRPSTARPPGEVVLLIDPGVINQPGTFMTEEDIADIDGLTDSDQQTMEKYLRGALIPQTFYEAARRRIVTGITGEETVQHTQFVSGYRQVYNTVDRFAKGQDMDPVFGGMRPLNFSTWEVKLPTIPATAIQRVIVKSEDLRDQLQAEFGDDLEVIFDPSYGRGGYQNLERTEDFEKQFLQIVEADYTARSTQLGAAKSSEKEVVTMVLGRGAVDSQKADSRITDRSNPSWFDPTTYPDDQAVIDEIAKSSQGSTYISGHWSRSWIDGQMYDREFVVVGVERLKDQPTICRITEVKTINPSKVVSG